MRKELWANSSGSTIGRGWRVLRTTIAPSSAAAAAKAPSVGDRRPAPVVALDDAEGDQRQPERQHQRPGKVGQPAVRDRPLGQARRPASRIAAPSGRLTRKTRRQSESSTRAPPRVGPGRRRRRRGGAPEADSRRAPLDREAVEDDRQRGRGDQRRADSLQDAEGDQRLERRRHRAEQAGGGEAGDAEQEDPLVAEAVGEAAGRHQQRRDHDEVAVEHPGEGATIGPGKGRRDVRKGDVDDRRVEKGDEGAGTGDRHRCFMTTVIHRGRHYTMSMGIESLEEPRTSSRESRDGRRRLLDGARRLLAEKGYAGMELRDVAERGKAPRGSIYHHFPGGKRQLAVEAATLEGLEIREMIERSLAERGLRRDADDVRRDLPPPRQGPPGADRLPGRRRRARPPRGPGARRRGHRRPSELGSARSPPRCATRASAQETPRPSPASSSRRSRGPCCAPAPRAARSRSTRRSAASSRRSTRCWPTRTEADPRRW